jgi:hypothetical protein
MTPKEKAKELFNNIYYIEDSNDNYPMSCETAKKCALIAVNEIIKEIVINLHRHDMVDRYSYWEDVKKQIDKYE